MNKDLAAGVAWGVGIVVLALAASAARSAGAIDSDTVTRLVIGANGLMIAWYGNRMPKLFAPTEAARRVQRVGGWAMFLSGTVYATLWAFAPMQVAITGGCAAVVGGMAVTLGYCIRQRQRHTAA
jgi:hypothetical protein